MGRGYWIHVLDPAILRPRLLATVRPDQDLEPLNNFPSKEDIHVSAGDAPAQPRMVRSVGTSRASGESPKTVETQDTIRFFPGEDLQTLAISNLGDGAGAGGGIMLWEALWEPLTDRATPEPWIRLFASSNEAERRDDDGRLLDPHTTLRGVTTLENDQVYLRLDRRHLGRGVHEGALRLRTSVGDQVYRVVVEIPGLEGDFRGYAVVETVNGRRNPVPDIDLAVSFYEDPKVEGLLRGLVDSSQALLWPVDVPLIGHRVADQDNQFVLAGSFILPPGDQNAEPFGVWDENDASAGPDVDWLNDGKLDTRNPFPFPIQRTVQLEGSLIAANPRDGYILEGRYEELVHGMSRDPIRLSGRFRLERTSLTPMASRRSSGADNGREPVVVRRSVLRPAVVVPAGDSRSFPLTVQTEMEVRSLQLGLTLARPLPHSALRLRLVSPGPDSRELDLYDGRRPADRIPPTLLEGVAFPNGRPFSGDEADFVARLTKTRTGPSADQQWTLVVDNVGDDAVVLEGWQLRLEGQPVTDVVGVVESGKDPVAGARVSAVGLPVSVGTALSDATGHFVISRVPLMPLNLLARQAGYFEVEAERPGISLRQMQAFGALSNGVLSAREQELAGRFNALTGVPTVAAGVDGFTAGSASAPFTLNLVAPAAGTPVRIQGGPRELTVGSELALVAPNVGDGAVWDLGDGTVVEAPEVRHAYTRPGVYPVSLRRMADGPTPLDSVEVVVVGAPGTFPASPSALGGLDSGLPEVTRNASYTMHLQALAFTAAGWMPAVGGRYAVNTATNRPSGSTNDFGAAFHPGMTVQHMYAASMDQDLAPRLSPADRTLPFVNDGFVALATTSLIHADNDWREEDFNYVLDAFRWRQSLSFDGLFEYQVPLDGEEGWLVWGLVPPNFQDFLTVPGQAKDGVEFRVGGPDSSFHPHTGTTPIPGAPGEPPIRHCRMACSLRMPYLRHQSDYLGTAEPRDRRADPRQPTLGPGPSVPGDQSRNLHFRLQTGILRFQ